MEVKKANVSRISAPVTAPPRVVFTPLELLMAERVNEPVIGIEETKAFKTLHRPTAIISCEASTILPLAETTKSVKTIDYIFSDLQKAFAIAIDSSIEIRGMVKTDAPKLDTIWRKPTSVPLLHVEKGGGFSGGKPGVIFPLTLNGNQLSVFNK